VVVQVGSMRSYWNGLASPLKTRCHESTSPGAVDVPSARLIGRRRTHKSAR
jgi:hypothetical protein